MKKDKDREGFTDLGGAFKKMYGELGLDKKFKESELVQSWPVLMGSVISSRTGKIYIRRNILFVEILSAPLRNELEMSKLQIINKITEALGECPVSDIKFI